MQLIADGRVMGKLRQLLSPEPSATGGWQSTGIGVSLVLLVYVADQSFKELAVKIQINAEPICYGMKVGGYNKASDKRWCRSK